MSYQVRAWAVVKDGSIVVLSGDADSVLFDAECCEGGRVVPLVEDRGERPALRALLDALLDSRGIVMTKRENGDPVSKMCLAVEAAHTALGERR